MRRINAFLATSLAFRRIAANPLNFQLFIFIAKRSGTRLDDIRTRDSTKIGRLKIIRNRRDSRDVECEFN